MTDTKTPTALEMLRELEYSFNHGEANEYRARDIRKIIAALEREQAARDERCAQIRACLTRNERRRPWLSDVAEALALLDGGAK